MFVVNLLYAFAAGIGALLFSGLTLTLIGERACWDSLASIMVSTAFVLLGGAIAIGFMVLFAATFALGVI